MRSLVYAVLAPLSVVVLAGCGPTTEAGPWVSLDEYRVEVSDDIGSAEAEVRNAGEFGHTLLVTDADGRVVASTEVVPPGEAVRLDLALDPGTYQFTCRIVVQRPAGDIVDHYAKGMDLPVTID